MTDAHGTRYEPWFGNGMVGYKVTGASGKVRYVYLNPSDEDSAGKSNVFLYEGETGDPAQDSPQVFVLTGDAAA